MAYVKGVKQSFLAVAIGTGKTTVGFISCKGAVGILVRAFNAANGTNVTMSVDPSDDGVGISNNAPAMLDFVSPAGIANTNRGIYGQIVSITGGGSFVNFIATDFVRLSALIATAGNVSFE